MCVWCERFCRIRPFCFNQIDILQQRRRLVEMLTVGTARLEKTLTGAMVPTVSYATSAQCPILCYCHYTCVDCVRLGSPTHRHIWKKRQRCCVACIAATRCHVILCSLDSSMFITRVLCMSVGSRVACLMCVFVFILVPVHVVCVRVRVFACGIDVCLHVYYVCVRIFHSAAANPHEHPYSTVTVVIRCIVRLSKDLVDRCGNMSGSFRGRSSPNSKRSWWRVKCFGTRNNRILTVSLNGFKVCARG